MASDSWVDQDREYKLTDEEILSNFKEQRGQSYPYDKFLTELSDFRKRHGEPRLGAPMWVNPNIEIKIADLGNACWVVSIFSPSVRTV